MQHRQQIRDQLGILEERIEDLGALACANERDSVVSNHKIQFGSDVLLQEALESIRDLSHLVHEHQLFKSVNAQEFLLRVTGLLIQDSASQGFDVAISHFGEGKISLEMAELVMGAILAGLRASLKSLKAQTRTQRQKLHLFPTGSIYLEVRATPGEVLFRIIDDGAGFSTEGAATRQFQKLREHIARCGGWFGHSTFGGSGGGLIEFKVPLSHNRTESMVLKRGSLEVLIPTSCVAEVKPAGYEPPSGAEVYFLDEIEGLSTQGSNAQVFLLIGIADLRFYIGCDSISGKARARRVSGEEFIYEGAWMKSFGLYQENGMGRTLPLLDGTALAQFHKESEGEA